MIAISLVPGAVARGKGKGPFAAQIVPGTISLSCRHRGRIANRVQIGAQVAYSDVSRQVEHGLKTREGRAILHLSVLTAQGKVLARAKGRASLRLKVRGNRIYHTTWFLLEAKPSRRVLDYAYGSGDCRLLHRDNRQLRVGLAVNESIKAEISAASPRRRPIHTPGRGRAVARVGALPGHIGRQYSKSSSNQKLRSPALTACPPYPCLETAAQVLAWKESEARPFDEAVVPLAERVPAPGPRLLVGLDDGPWAYWSNFDLPSQGSSSTGNVYNFSHWQYVDSLYYYSHHLLSVPPTVWTDAAHRNGVSVLGTVTGDCSLCGAQMNELFEKHPKAAEERLYQLATAYGFDGWMIDVENGAKYSPQLLWVMEHLRKGDPGVQRPLQVVTYTAGEINLSPEFLPELEAAGEWQSDYYHAGFTHAPQQTFELLEQHPPLAEQRYSTYWATDVYRPYGENGPEQCGGRSSAEWVWNGFRCNNVKQLFANLGSARAATEPPGFFQSLALFAPAWTEFAGHDQTTAPRPERQVFQEADERFWSGVGGYRLTGNACTLAAPRQSSVSSLLPPRSSLTRIPFSTRFDTGEGDGFAIAGEQVVGKEKEWNFLAAQDALPTELCSESGNLSAGIDYEEAYDGGSSLLVNGSVTSEARRLYLYEAQAKLPAHPEFVLRYRAEGPEPRIAVWIGEKAYDLSVQGKPEREGEWTTIKSVPPEEAKAGTLTRLGIWFNPETSPERVKARIGELAVVDRSSYTPPEPITPVAEPAERPVQLKWEAPSVPIQYYNVWAVVPEAGSAEPGTPASECARFVGRAVMPRYDLGQPLFAFPAETKEFLVQPVAETGLAAELSLPTCPAFS
ncbi:MAG: endo-beta-N-acetylglucosaminidase [Solirubrobacterales bacterium]